MPPSAHCIKREGRLFLPEQSLNKPLVGLGNRKKKRAVDAFRKTRITFTALAKPSALVDTGVIYCGDNLEQRESERLPCNRKNLR